MILKLETIDMDDIDVLMLCVDHRGYDLLRENAELRKMANTCLQEVVFLTFS